MQIECVDREHGYQVIGSDKSKENKMKVKCLRTQAPYLTAGKIYNVVSHPGDDSKQVRCKVPEGAFEVINDKGRPIFCLTEDCAHAEWEVLNDAD